MNSVGEIRSVVLEFVESLPDGKERTRPIHLSGIQAGCVAGALGISVIDGKLALYTDKDLDSVYNLGELEKAVAKGLKNADPEYVSTLNPAHFRMHVDFEGGYESVIDLTTRQGFCVSELLGISMTEDDEIVGFSDEELITRFRLDEGAEKVAPEG